MCWFGSFRACTVLSAMENRRGSTPVYLFMHTRYTREQTLVVGLLGAECLGAPLGGAHSNTDIETTTKQRPSAKHVVRYSALENGVESLRLSVSTGWHGFWICLRFFTAPPLRH